MHRSRFLDAYELLARAFLGGIHRPRSYHSSPAAFAHVIAPQLFGAALILAGLLYLSPILINSIGLAWFGAVVVAATTTFATVIALVYFRVSLTTALQQDRKHWAKAAEELRQSKVRFDRALLGSSSGLWEWNISDDVVWMSPRFRELLGYSNECEFPNTIASWDSALHPDDKARVLAAAKDHLQRYELFDIEYRMQTKSGDYRWFNARGLAIRKEDGTPYLMSGSIQDIHDRKLAEHTLRQMEEYSHQKHKMESLGELAGGITHEFNNLLQAIGGQIQFAESALSHDSKVKSELKTASILVERAAHFSKELLAFSYRGISQPQLVCPNDVVKQLGAILRPMIGQNVVLSIRPGRALGGIRAHLASLQQALLNLCINARDAMPEGGTLTLSAELAELTAENASPFPGIEPGQFVRFSVCDTGCGIPEDIASKLFEPFFTTKGPGRGTGLGLSIAFDIAKEHHGFVDMESQLGMGSTFSIWIPIVRQYDERPAQSLEVSVHRDTSAVVLYVEDHEHVRRNTSRILTQSGYHVIVARDGLEALGEFEKHVSDIHLVLLDVSLPHLDGTEVFRQIRHNNPRIPVVFCTSHSARLTSTPLSSHHNTYLISKPFSPEDLRCVLEHALGTDCPVRI